MKYSFLFLLILFLSLNCAEQREGDINEEPSVTGKEITYSSNGTTLKGYIAYDENIEGPRPGVLVVHEWWGLNEYARKRADMLAELGYTALAVDMYGEGKQADHPEDAQKFAMSVMQNMDMAEARFNAGLKYLKEQPQTNPENTAAIGYCFGGGIVLRMALAGSDIDGAVSFHGSLPTDSVNNPKQVKAELLVLNGGDDPFVPEEQSEAFKKAMDNANIEYEFINYPGAVHSFTNPGADSTGKKFDMPLAYNKEADEKSWEEMEKFFNKIFE
jgi:dienelactone hydrolase